MQIRDIKFPGFRRLNEETDTGTIPPRPPVPSRTLTRLTGPQNPEDEPKKERLSAKLLKALLSTTPYFRYEYRYKNNTKITIRNTYKWKTSIFL